MRKISIGALAAAPKVKAEKGIPRRLNNGVPNNNDRNNANIFS